MMRTTNTETRFQNHPVKPTQQACLLYKWFINFDEIIFLEIIPPSRIVQILDAMG